jgi:hypothetical protein
MWAENRRCYRVQRVYILRPLQLDTEGPKIAKLASGTENQLKIRAGILKAYALLREALAKTRKVGIAQIVLRNKDNLCILKPQGQGLVLNALRFAPRDSTDQRTLSSLCGKDLKARYPLATLVDRRND